MTTASTLQDSLPHDDLWEGPIPSSLARRRKGLRPQFLAAGLILIGIILGLMVYGLTTAKAFWLTVDEVMQQRDALASERLRVNGVVVDGSERWNPEQVTLQFMIEDEENPEHKLPVVHYEPRPDNFHRAASVIVEGEFLEDGTFRADVLLLKCPSRYEEDPQAIQRKYAR